MQVVTKKDQGHHTCIRKKIDFKWKIFERGEEGYYTMMKGWFTGNMYAIVNMYASQSTQIDEGNIDRTEVRDSNTVNSMGFQYPTFNNG